jgi:hypothetical protein
VTGIELIIISKRINLSIIYIKMEIINLIKILKKSGPSKIVELFNIFWFVFKNVAVLWLCYTVSGFIGQRIKNKNFMVQWLKNQPRWPRLQTSN